MPLWVGSISSISILCLIFVLIYERAKNGTLTLARREPRARARARLGRGGEPQQERLPRERESRDPHAADRDPRLRGAAAARQRSGRDPERLREHAEHDPAQREHLLDIINDILDLSKIAAGRFDVERVPVAPVALVSDVVALMSIRARAKGLTLSVECESPLPEAFETDPRRLRQVLVNLIGNALKFTEAGRVVLRVSPRAGAGEPRLRFEIRDSASASAKSRWRACSSRSRRRMPRPRADTAARAWSLDLQALGRAARRPDRRRESAGRGQRVLGGAPVQPLELEPVSHA